MPIQFKFKFSRSQALLIWSTHLFAAAVVVVYLALPWLKWSCLLGLALSLAWEHGQLLKYAGLRLRVLSARQAIELSDGDETHFFAKYKVYETRWFAILSLIETRNSRTLILNSDSFETVQDYRRCRFQLRQLAGQHAA